MLDPREAARDRRMLLVPWLAVAVYCLTRTAQDTAALFSDDAFYYFQIARNIVRGLGPTFDGVNMANGFHPLWMVVILPVVAVIRTPEGCAWALMGLSLALWGASLWLAHLVATRWFGRVAGLFAAAVLVSPTAGLLALNGLESGLVILLVLGLAAMPSAERMLRGIGGIADGLRVGTMLGLIFLARLDSAFLVVVFLSIAGLKGLRRKGGGVPSVLAAMLAAAAFAGAYFAWNLANFGHIMPITSTIKNSFPVVHLQLAHRIHDPYFFAWLVQMIFTAGVGLAFVTRGGRRYLGLEDGAPGVAMVPALAAGTLLQYLFSLFFVASQAWHYASAVPGLALAAGALFGGLGREANRRAMLVSGYAVLLACALAAGYKFYLQRTGAAIVRTFYETAVWARTTLPADAVLGLTDSGTMGFYSGRRVINLDGYVNSYSFLDEWHAGRGKEYFRRQGIQYLVICWMPPDIVARVNSPGGYNLGGMKSNFIYGQLNMEALGTSSEVFRSTPYTGYGRGQPLSILVFKVTPELLKAP